MKNHTKVYMTFFYLDESDFIGCEMCGSEATDIHHILRRGIGGSKCKDYIENLSALCRDCHNMAETNKEFNVYVRIRHLELINKYLYENHISKNKHS
ncbi:MAG: hypothetical protein Tp164SUR323001_29 [Prokaryotic dsDNA virus sp.]|jgi:hypothetical protein|nr:MAG: hypothetical protein Tp164SUR323001_29 [Prokaryotic dsDNA virus sp.]|tara:strand:+ start:531 stop:821 length:291 start_codon:yes stop_codon:yes gene_type:complete